MTIYGSCYRENFTVNSYGEIVDSGNGRTGYILRGNEILNGNFKTVGWLHYGGAVNYANDYSGNRLFMRWSD